MFNGGNVFDTTVPTFAAGQVIPRVFTMDDTEGCSCEDIGDLMGLERIVDLNGCSAQLLDRFIQLRGLGFFD